MAVIMINSVTVAATPISHVGMVGVGVGDGTSIGVGDGVGVSGLSDDEVLGLWDELAAEVFKGMDPEEVKGVRLVVNSDGVLDGF